MAQWRRTLCSVLTGLSLTMSSSGFGYDKDDHKVTAEIQKKVQDPIVLVTSLVKTPCEKIPFYEANPRECVEGKGVSRSIYLGSGVVLASKQGELYVLTSNHVLPDKLEGVNFPLVNNKHAFVLSRDYWRDLALLRVVGSNAELAKINAFRNPFRGCFGEDVSLGDYVTFFGYDTSGLSYNDGKVHSIEDKMLFKIKAPPIIFGNSGSPVYGFVDGAPMIIGVLAFKEERDIIGGVVSATYVNEFLADTSLKHYSCVEREKAVKTEQKPTEK